MLKPAIYILCYNDENTIEVIFKYLNLIDTSEFEFIIVDDKSTDRTLEYIKYYANIYNVRVIKNKVNLGYGGSLKAICNDASRHHYSFFGIFPGDCQRKFFDLNKMIRIAVSRNFDVVIGCKHYYLKGEKGSVRRLFGNFLIERTCQFLFNKNIRDPLAGFKVYKTESAKKIISNCSDRFGFDIDYLFWSELNSYRKYYYNANVSYLNHKTTISNIQTQGLKMFVRIIIYFIIMNLLKVI